MSKKEIIEELLGMQLTDLEMQYISEDWSLFYERCETYSKDSVVADMVRLYITDMRKEQAEQEEYKKMSTSML